jgi:hypothetical protein
MGCGKLPNLQHCASCSIVQCQVDFHVCWMPSAMRACLAVDIEQQNACCNWLPRVGLCHVCSNQLTGTIPASWGGIGNSTLAMVKGRLFLWSNQLSGPVPAGLFKPVGHAALPGTDCCG